MKGVITHEGLGDKMAQQKYGREVEAGRLPSPQDDITEVLEDECSIVLRVTDGT